MIHLWGKNQEKDSRGSATVEAVIAFVGFLFVIFTILNVTNYCRAQMLISNAMDTVTKELTQYSYFYKASGLQKFGEEIQAIGAEGEANLNTIATSVGDLYTAMSGAVDTTLAEGAGLGDRLSNGNINVQDLNNALTNVDASFTHIKTNLNDMNTKFMDVYNNPVLYMKSLVAVAGNEGLELAKSHVLAAPLAKGLLLKHFGSNKDEADKLRSCYRNCLVLASENGCKTVDFPSISTGVYHFPLEKASEIAIKTIAEYLFEHPEIERVRMVCFDERTKGYYEKALEKLK